MIYDSIIKCAIRCAMVTACVLGMAQCQARTNEAKQQTDAQAIKAGMTQAPDGRWVTK